MLPSELTALVVFFEQLGLALCGAACLWGIFFSVNAETTKEEGKKKIFNDISNKLFIPFVLGFVISTLVWLLRIFSRSGFASRHTFNLFSDLSHMSQYVERSVPVLWLIFIFFSLSFIIFSSFWKKKFPHLVRTFYLISFILVFILISFPTGVANFTNDHLFFIKHGFPLIFTIGTVMIVDFLFFFTRSSLRAKRAVFPYFTTLNKFIWIGLGIHFFTDWVSGAQIALSPVFYFVQIVTAVIIINGMLFTGPLTEVIISGVSERRVKPLEKKWGIISGISGVISFSSWTSLTLATLLPNIPLSLSYLLAIYVIKLVVIYVAFLFIEWMTDIPLSFVNTN
ncbi:MAG: hypothetical protein PHS53_04200 [Candidatus Pacebacteria bacterium]|nr:hypothetical protein [Candidatus Paceibacterota bacterium]MDD5357320.1 hypothetical protein [Candidatus Paceibacterota bacterium]